MNQVNPVTGEKPFDPLTDKAPGDVAVIVVSTALTGWKAYRFLTSRGRQKWKFGKQLVVALGIDALIIGYFTSKYAGA
jgi:hypothetical protein